MFLASVAELGIEAHTWGSYIICLISCCCCDISLNLTQRCRQKYNLTSPQCPLEVVCACVCVWKFKCVWRCLCAQAANLCMLAFACLMCVHALKWAQLCVCVRCSLKVPLIVMFKASAVQLVSLYGIFLAASITLCGLGLSQRKPTRSDWLMHWRYLECYFSPHLNLYW